MSPSEHDIDLAAAYALDALDAEERQNFRAHLSNCSTCQSELADLRGVVAVLPLACESSEPSEQVRERLLQAIHEEPVSRPKFESIAGGKTMPQPARRRLPRVPSVIAVAAAAVIAALGVWNLNLQQRVNTEDKTVAYQQKVNTALASGARVAPLAVTSGSSEIGAAIVQPRGKQTPYLIVKGLSRPSASKVYELWLMRGNSPRKAAVFSLAGDSPQIVPFPVSTAGYNIAAVTVEQGPDGVSRPTTKPVLQGTLSA